MSGVVCPACGVAVLPGYVRCPKCRKPLPRRVTTQVSGGTALDSGSRLGAMAAIAAAVLVGGGVIAYFGLRGDPPAAQPAADEQPEPDEQLAPEPDTFSAPEAPVVEQAPDAPTPAQVAGELERNLKRQRLWATVTVVGERVDVRSGSCGDAAMAAQLGASSPALKAAGLTSLRCLEQSGRVVSTRDL
jgi:hypothetical protein